MHRFRVSAILAATAMLSACGPSSITSRPVTTADTVVKGPIYHLPATKLSFTLAYKLNQCAASAEIALDKVTINSPTVIPDQSAGATFAIDPKELTNWMKALESAKLELQGGLLKTVNYKAKDKTQETVASAVSFLSKVPLLAAGVAGLANPCTSEADALVKRRDDLRTRLSQLSDTRGKVLDALVSGKDLSKDAVEGLSAKFKAASELMTQVGTELASVEKGLTVEHTVTAVPDRKASYIDLPVDASWFTQWASSTATVDTVRVSLSPVNGAMPFATKCDGCVEDKGIYYRDPALADIKVQLVKPGGTPVHLGTTTQAVFQLGRVGFLPITNGTFESSSVTVEQDANGYLTSIEYKSDAARAKALFDTLDSTAGTVTNAKVQQINDRKATIEAETGLINAETNLINAKKNKQAAEKEAASN